MPNPTLPMLTCQKCGHVWIPRVIRDKGQPMAYWCPKCRTAKWNVKETSST